MGRRLLIGAFAVAALTAGCGGGSKSNGEAGRPANQVFADAKEAALQAKSVHVSGALVDNGTPLTLDLVLAHSKGKGAMSENHLSFELVRIGDAAYIRGSSAFLSSFAGKTAAQLLRGKWLKGSASTGNLAALAPLTDISGLFTGLFGQHGKLVNRGETEFKGVKAVEIGDPSDGSTLYVAATGPPYPLGARQTKANRGSVTFDHWNEDVSFSAPKGAVDIGKLGG